MPQEVSDEQIHAEVAAILETGPTGQDLTERPETPPTEPAAAAQGETPPAAVPPVTVAELDDKTAKKIAIARQAQQQALLERQQAAAERERLAKDLAELQSFRQAVAQAQASGDMVALARAHGITPARDHAEVVLAEAMGKDAPEGLQLRALISQQQRQLQALQADMARRDREVQEREQRLTQEQQEQQVRERVRAELVPKFGESAAAVRALASHPEFGAGVINTGIQRYREMAQLDADITPEDGFVPVAEALERMVVHLMSDPVVAARVQKQLSAKGAPPPKPQPTPPADAQQPAPTMSNKQHFSTTPPPAGDLAAYEKQVRAEVDALIRAQQQKQ